MAQPAASSICICICILYLSQSYLHAGEYPKSMPYVTTSVALKLELHVSLIEPNVSHIFD